MLNNKPELKSKGGLKRISKAFTYSIQGFKAAFTHEAAFRQELLLGAILLPLSFLISRNLIELLILISTLILVLITELLNSAIEALADAITVERNTLIGRAKDIASAAVFCSLTLCVIVWLAIIIDIAFAL